MRNGRIATSVKQRISDEEPRDPLIAGFAQRVRLERGQSPRTAIEYSRDLELFGAFLGGVLPEDGRPLPPRRGAEATATTPAIPARIGPFAGLSAASSSDIRRWILWMMGARKHSPTAVRRKIAALRAFYQYVKLEGLREDDPTIGVPLPKRPERQPHHVAKVDVLRILETVIAGQDTFERLRNAAILEVFYASGIRLAELQGLNLSDVDLDGKRLRVIGKGNKQRTVFLSDRAVAALLRYLEVRPRGAEDAVFLGRSVGAGQRGRISTGRAGEIVRGYARVCGFAGVSPHILRHSFATHLLEGGADIMVIKELLGHESVATTQIYTNISNEHMRRAYDKAMGGDIE